VAVNWRVIWLGSGAISGAVVGGVRIRGYVGHFLTRLLSEKKKKKTNVTNFRRNSMRAYSRTFVLKMEAEYSSETLITT
jgi:hypothetical protein